MFKNATFSDDLCIIIASVYVDRPPFGGEFYLWLVIKCFSVFITPDVAMMVSGKKQYGYEPMRTNDDAEHRLKQLCRLSQLYKFIISNY